MAPVGRKSTRILLTGSPGCGKTTLVERLLAELRIPVSGFITKEIRESGHRTGFRITGISGTEETLAHLNIDSGFRVGKYGVDVEALDRIIETEFAEPIANLIVVDEIGKMELLSERFISLIETLWESETTILATIMSARQPICDRLKADSRSKVITLNHRNHKEVFGEIRNLCDLSLVV